MAEEGVKTLDPSTIEIPSGKVQRPKFLERKDQKTETDFDENARFYIDAIKDYARERVQPSKYREIYSAIGKTIIQELERIKKLGKNVGEFLTKCEQQYQTIHNETPDSRQREQLDWKTHFAGIRAEFASMQALSQMGYDVYHGSDREDTDLNVDFLIDFNTSKGEGDPSQIAAVQVKSVSVPFLGDYRDFPTQYVFDVSTDEKIEHLRKYLEKLNLIHRLTRSGRNIHVDDIINDAGGSRGIKKYANSFTNCKPVIILFQYNSTNRPLDKNTLELSRSFYSQMSKEIEGLLFEE